MRTIILVKLISRQGDGTYTVQEADKAGNPRGGQITGIAPNLPGALITTGTAKLYAMSMDVAGNLIFFLPDAFVQEALSQVFTLASDDTTNATIWRTYKHATDPLQEVAYIKFLNPITMTSGTHKLLMTVRDNFLGPNSIHLTVPATSRAVFKLHQINEAFDISTITWAAQPAMGAIASEIEAVGANTGNFVKCALSFVGVFAVATVYGLAMKFDHWNGVAPANGAAVIHYDAPASSGVFNVYVSAGELPINE